MVEIKIIMDESGTFSVNTSEELPVFVAIGALEVAKNMLITNGVNPNLEYDVEQVMEGVQ